MTGCFFVSDNALTHSVDVFRRTDDFIRRHCLKVTEPEMKQDWFPPVFFWVTRPECDTKLEIFDI